MGQVADEIYRQVQTLPIDLEKEVLHYVEYLKAKHQNACQLQDLQQAQTKVLDTLWDTPEDSIWDRV